MLLFVDSCEWGKSFSYYVVSCKYLWFGGWGSGLGLWSNISRFSDDTCFSETHILTVSCLALIDLFLMNLHCFFQSNNPKNDIYLMVKLHNILINKN